MLDVNKAKPKTAPYRLRDGDGLFLFVATTGVKSWQLRHKLGKKGQTATLGKFPNVSLEKARERAEEARATPPEPPA